MRKTAYLFLAAAIILIGTGSAWADLTDGLVAHYEFEEGLGDTAYDSAGSNDGTLINEPNWTAGQIGGALDFDGMDDYVDCGASFASVTASTTKTITAWVASDSTKYPGNTYAGGGRIITLYRQSGSSAFTIYGYGDPATWRGLYRKPGDTAQQIDSEVLVQENTWTHIALVQNGTEIHLYVNGELIKVANDAAAPSLTGPTNADIGAYWEGYCCFFNGLIDDVRIYNRALSTTEVQKLYLCESKVLESLDIAGPNEVAEDSQIQYQAIANYNNGSSADVTDLVDWLAWPEAICGIDETGLLSTEILNTPAAEVTVHAAYAEGGIEVDAEKQVKVLSMCPASGGALDFDGTDDYVLIGNNEDFDFGSDTDFSVCVWVKTSGTGHWPYTAIIDKHKAGYRPYEGFMLYLDDTGRLKIQINDSSGLGELYSNASVIDNNWHFITVVADRDANCEIYVDGDNDASFSISAIGNINNDTPLAIGRSMDYNGQYFDGLIDDVRIYNRALSAEEIESLYQGGQVDNTGLVGQWNFDEGEGQIAHDSSGNENDGRLGSTSEADDSDPVWVDGGVPRVCNVPQIMRRNLHGAIALKLDSMKNIHTALQKEVATLRMLYRIIRNKDYGVLKKINLLKARKHIFGAIIKEFHAKRQLQQSIAELKAALQALNGEILPPDKPKQLAPAFGRRSSSRAR